MIEFPCPTCRTLMRMPDASAGKETPCTVCKRSVTVPVPPGREPPPPPPAPEEERRSSRRERRRDDDYDDYDRDRRDRRDYRDDRDYYDDRRGFRCPHCRSDRRPQMRNEISETGWILFIVLLAVFFPLCWIGLLQRENVKYCADCGAKLGKFV